MSLSPIITTFFLLLGAGVVLCFEPGCSFINNQCMYNVRLGHKGQCDSNNAATPDSSKDVSRFSTELAALKKQFQAFQRNSKDLQTVQTYLNQSKIDKAVLLQQLAEKEVELNTTEQELSHLLKQARSEILDLRSEASKAKMENLSLKTQLSEAQRDFQTCQTALGMPTDTPTQVPSSDVGLVKYCNFNKGWCGFKNLKTSPIFHNMTSRSTLSTGPSVEHSTGSKLGNYIGLNSRVDRDNCKGSSCNRVAQIESDILQPANSYCIMFYYVMYGEDVQTLNVNVQIGGGTGYPVWSRQGNQGNNWLLGQVDLDYEYTSQKFKVDFTASTKANWDYKTTRHYHMLYADIGIDDVYIYNSTCQEVHQCPRTAYRFKDPSTNKTTCYTIHPTPKTWTQAFDVCRKEGPMTSLASINNKDEQSFLVSLIKGNAGLNAVGRNGFYTSGNDLHTEKTFRWAEKGDMLNDMDYKNWHTGQPNNVGGDQDCLLMEYANDDYSWGDVDCDSAHPFICETNL